MIPVGVGTRVTGYKPSVVAAASLLSAASDLFPAQFAAFRSAVRACIFLDKVRAGDIISYLYVICISFLFSISVLKFGDDIYSSYCNKSASSVNHATCFYILYFRFLILKDKIIKLV